MTINSKEPKKQNTKSIDPPFALSYFCYKDRIEKAGLAFICFYTGFIFP